tara:strand:+ start:615 stop:1091 length:477 start_codon:yes stop_codon:yes gene_type:complete
MTINEIKYDIDMELQRVKGDKYRELYNFNYSIEYDSEFVEEDIKPNLRGDLKERVELCLEAVKTFERFKQDTGLESRQFVIHKSYQDRPELAACLSTIQFAIRDNRLDLFVFARSQNYDNNFDYDNQTYMTILKHLENFTDIKPRNIHVHVTSLHRYC